MKSRVIAMYLPQFHPIPLNDEWWGPGFTEWTNVATARPLFRGHYQPRIPADLGFYDLRLSETREAQAKMAKEAGIEGFMYWHYWFGKGKRLLERPFQEVLEYGKPDYPFCLGWANHSWSRKTWTAKNGGDTKTKLLEQTYIESEYVDHFYDVLPAFKDQRYITVDGKPFFLIYNILLMPDFKRFKQIWNELAMQNGLKGIHFVGNIMGYEAEQKKMDIINSGVDATVLSNFVSAQMKCSSKIGVYWKNLLTKKFNIGLNLYDYADIIKNIHSDLEKREDIYPVVYPQYDRTPRAGRKGLILKNTTPELYGKYLRETLETVKDKQYEHQIVMINAWNEWGEGAYIEPDMKYGCRFLEETRDAILSDS